jgi:hypothetical protein
MLSEMKTDERRRARELRARGWSVKEIERELGVVARSRLGPIVAAERKAAAARKLRRLYQQEGMRRAREHDAGYAAGCMLFWAEGSKDRNSFKVVNSDPDLLALVTRFLRTYFGVEDSQIRIRCNLFADHISRQQEIESFWLAKLELPPSSLRRSAVNAYSKYSQKKRTNKLPYGTCEIVVNRTRIVQTIYGSTQEYGGFDRPEWLD